MPLTMVQPGKRVRVTALCGGHGLRQRVASMGIFPGAELRLVKSGLSGPVIVEVRRSRFVMGRGMAHRVMVEPLP